jgi:hypothetical protein
MDSETAAFVNQINEGTKEMVEASGRKYEPQTEDEAITPSQEDRQKLSDLIVGQINEGTKEQKEYIAWYEKK